MTPGAHYYNELDPACCDGLRLEISRGRLPAGVVDQRSITDVRPEDVHGFAHCHFFAGIGGAALAVRLAGWPDERELWTGGFPCQDISSAGKGAGLEGSRSGLWFEWLRLIDACRPLRLLVENVPALRTRGADRVLDDLEGLGYACRPVVVGAEHVGAPHRRHRVWVVADGSRQQRGQRAEWDRVGFCGAEGTLADARCEHGGTSRHAADGAAPERSEAVRVDQRRGEAGGTVAHTNSDALRQQRRCTGGDRPAAEVARRDGAGSVADTERGGCEEGRRDIDAERGPVPGGPPELADAAIRRPQAIREHDARRGESNAPSGRRDLWPARPGQPQHEWEAPRLTQFELGCLPHGLPVRLVRARNKSRLKQFGNAWVPQNAAVVLRAWMAAEQECAA